LSGKNFGRQEPFSELVLLAAPFFSKLFREERAVELLQYLYVHDNNLFSFSHCLFAQDGDDILGLVVGYDWQTKQGEQLSTGYLMIKHLGLQFFKALPALLKLDAQVSRISREDYYIAFWLFINKCKHGCRHSINEAR